MKNKEMMKKNIILLIALLIPAFAIKGVVKTDDEKIQKSSQKVVDRINIDKTDLMEAFQKEFGLSYANIKETVQKDALQPRDLKILEQKAIRFKLLAAQTLIFISMASVGRTLAYRLKAAEEYYPEAYTPSGLAYVIAPIGIYAAFDELVNIMSDYEAWTVLMLRKEGKAKKEEIAADIEESVADLFTQEEKVYEAREDARLEAAKQKIAEAEAMAAKIAAEAQKAANEAQKKAAYEAAAAKTAKTELKRKEALAAQRIAEEEQKRAEKNKTIATKAKQDLKKVGDAIEGAAKQLGTAAKELGNKFSKLFKK